MEECSSQGVYTRPQGHPAVRDCFVRILVAGASGVIGAPVTRRLVLNGHEVFGTTRRADR